MGDDGLLRERRRRRVREKVCAIEGGKGTFFPSLRVASLRYPTLSYPILPYPTDHAKERTGTVVSGMSNFGKGRQTRQTQQDGQAKEDHGIQPHPHRVHAIRNQEGVREEGAV